MTTFGIAELRRERGQTLVQFAEDLGIRSVGHLSQIIRGESPVSFDIALKLEELSGKRIDAATLNADVARARAGVNGSTMAAADTAAETNAPACKRAPLTTPPVTAPEDGLSLTTRRVA